jgi:hypothetical protein
MVIRNSTSRCEDGDEEENENDEPPTPPSSPVLTSQQSQTSTYCELDKFTALGKLGTSTSKERRTVKKGRIDETEEQRIRKNQFTKEQLQLFRLQKREYQRMRSTVIVHFNNSLSIESEIQNLLHEDHIQLRVQVLLP